MVVFHHQRRDDAAPRRPEKDLAPSPANVATSDGAAAATAATALTTATNGRHRLRCRARRRSSTSRRSTPRCGDVRGQGCGGCRAARYCAGFVKRQPLRAGAPWRLFLDVPLFSAGTYGRMGAPAMELLNTLSIHASASGTVVKGVVGGCLARAQCEPARAMELMFRAGLMVTARCSRFERRLCAFC
jgi:hypothetical protein